MAAPPAGLHELVARIADDVLFAHALEVDALARIPPDHFGALAAAGLFGAAGPAAAGGLDLDPRALRRVRETLAGGCLTTAFVWTQHAGVVRRLRNAPPGCASSGCPTSAPGGCSAGSCSPGCCPRRSRCCASSPRTAASG